MPDSSCKRVKKTDGISPSCKSKISSSIEDLLTPEKSNFSRLFQCLREFLDSPYDWHFLQCASSRLQHVRSQMQRCRELFSADVRTWDEERLRAESNKEAPDGDRILFLAGARRVHLFMAQQLLTTLQCLTGNEKVAGWPKPKSGWWESSMDADFFGEDPADCFSQELLDRGVLWAVVKLMERYPDDYQVQHGGCALLWKLEIPQGHRGHQLLPRCSLLLVNAMQAFPSAMDLQKFAILAIHRLQRCRDSCLFSIEAVNAISVAMDAFPRSQTLQNIALRALGCLMKHICVEDDTASKAGFCSLSRAADRVRTPELLGLAWYGIVKCLKRGVCLPEFLNHGGISKISRALLDEYNEDNEDQTLTGQLVKAWRIVCAEPGTQVKEDDVRMVLEALRTELEYDAMKDYCLAFGHLAKRSDSWATWLSDPGLIGRIVKYMEDVKVCDDEHEFVKSQNKGLSNATFALSHLKLDPQYSLRAIRMTLWAMKQCKELDVQLHGVCLLSKLSKTDVAKATTLDACERVAVAMRDHAHENMQLEGCRALSNLFCCPANKAKLAAVGGVGILLNAIERYPLSSCIKSEGRQLLKIMSQDEAAVALVPEPLRCVKLFSS